MKKTVWLVLAVLVPATALAGYESAVEESIIERALEGQRLIFARDYPAATKVFAELERMYPEHPIGYFGQMAVLEMRMLEKEDFHLGESFEKLAERGKKAIVRTYNRKPSDFDLLVSGSLIGLEGFYKARRKDWWDAYTLGVKSRQIFKRIKRRNADFYDADFGLGMYLYWRSVFLEDLPFLSLFSDTRDEGIALVTGVVDHGRFARQLAEVNLGMIWLEERRFSKAHAIFDKYAKRYPKNVLIRMFDGRTLIAAKRYDEAVPQFRAALETEPTLIKGHFFIGLARVLQKKPAHYDEAERALMRFLEAAPRGEWKASANYWLGKLEEQRGNKATAKAYYSEALRLNPNLKKLKLRIRGLGSGL